MPNARSTGSKGVPTSKRDVAATPPASKTQAAPREPAVVPSRQPAGQHSFLPLIITCAVVLMFCLLILASVGLDTWLS